MGKALKMDKDSRIRRERKRLGLLYEELPQNRLALMQGLLDQAAFMRVTMDDLQVTINAQGVTEEYQNGAAQSGQKVSAAMQSYQGMVKNYKAVIDLLDKALPAERVKGKLEALLGD